MDTRILEYFLAVAREENITRAAGILRVSQPSLSRQIMQLEEEIGKPLLIRGSKNVSLTPEGLLFKNRAEEILSLVDKTKKELLNDSDYIAGDIYLASMESEGFRPLADLIARFQRRYPQVCFRVTSEHSTVIARQAEQGLVDFGLLMGEVSREKFCAVPVAISEDWGVLVPDGHPLTDRAPLTADDLRPWPLICPERILENGSFARDFGQPREFQIAATYNLIGNVLTMVKAGMGAALCFFREEYAARGLRFLPLTPARGEKTAHIIWRRDHLFSQAAERFRQEICNAFSKSQQI